MIEKIRHEILLQFDQCLDQLSADKVPLNPEIINEIKRSIETYDATLFYDVMDKRKLASFFDHTYLKPDCSYETIDKLAEECLSHGFCSICIPPCFVGYARTRKNTVKIATVIGFPLGYNEIKVKEIEAKQALHSGADELDMVINGAFLKEKQYFYIFNEIQNIKIIAGTNVVKVILETSNLTLQEKILGSLISIIAGVDFIKTSTGFSDKGATLEDIILMKMIAGKKGVKASGGIKTYDFVKQLILHGVDRIGASASVEIVKASSFKFSTSAKS